jgi:CHAT domain-containing protein
MAGAKSLMTSLWQVPVEPTTAVMTAFYDNLWKNERNGGPLGKAAALQQAQLSVMQANSQKFNDSRPAEWAGWLMSGEWR